MSRPATELAEIICRYGDSFMSGHQPLGNHKGVLKAIASCRTAQLGGHVDRCGECGHIRISYNSCRNRHCPKCQTVNKERWIMAREADLLPAGYFHLVFTLPECLNAYCLSFPNQVYSLLFVSVRDTLYAFAVDPKHLGAEIGYLSVLHTWGQTLVLHPHVHCIVPAGGITVKGNWKHARGKGRYLFPVKALSQVFRAKFRDGLKQVAQKTGFEVTLQLLQQMHRSSWVVYAKEPFMGPQQVIGYLSQYTHRVAIGNHRLVSATNEKVTFRYKDYADGSRQKVMSLDATEFLRRFCLHILPKRFVRIRHYGFLSSRRKSVELPALQGKVDCQQEVSQIKEKVVKLTWQQVCIRRFNYDPGLCPVCRKGRMQTIEVLPRSPPVGFSLPASSVAM